MLEIAEATRDYIIQLLVQSQYIVDPISPFNPWLVAACKEIPEQAIKKWVLFSINRTDYITIQCRDYSITDSRFNFEHGHNIAWSDPDLLDKIQSYVI